VKSTFVYLRRLGALSLTSVETALIYIGIPVLVIVVITGLVFAGDMRRAKRYRPGRPFEFRPVWFLSAPDHVDGGRPAGAGSTKELTAGETRAALTTAPAAAGTGNSTLTGGASDRW
jgi:hypothetical protein